MKIFFTHLLFFIVLSFPTVVFCQVTEVEVYGPSEIQIGMEAHYYVFFYGGDQGLTRLPSGGSGEWIYYVENSQYETDTDLKLIFQKTGKENIYYYYSDYDNTYWDGLEVTVKEAVSPCAGITPVGADVSREGSGTLKLMANPAPSDFIYQWYDASGKQLVSENKDFITPVLSSTTTYQLAYKHTTGCLTSKINVKAIIVYKPDPGSSHNYVKTYTALEANSAAEELISGNNQISQKDFVYYDGLGRPIQKVQKHASPSGHDIVTPVTYDAFGRSSIQYLPYAKNYDASAGDLHETALEDHKYYFNNHFGGNSGDFAFTHSDFDGSPLNRVTAVYAPGKPWAKATDETGQPSGGEGRPVKTDYLNNTAEDQVLLWELVADELAHSEYAVGTLYKTVITDENGNQTQEFKDLQGRTVLKKVQASDTEWASTYYVYDDWGNLIYVLPPEAVNTYGSGGSRIVGPEGYYLVENPVDYASVAGASNGKIAYLPGASVTIKPTTTLSPGVHIFSSEGTVVQGGIDHWIFSYKYDGRNRMVEKKVPGAEPMYMVYDKLDRLVLTQDGNQRKASKWAFTKYDAFDRPVITGEKVIAGDVEVIRNAVKNHGTMYESYTGSGTSKYSDSAYPTSISEAEIHSITYYDNYRFTSKEYSLPSQLGSTAKGKIIPTASYAIKGQVTGTKVKILGTTNDYIETVNFYDDRYRLIQSKVVNHKDGTEVASTQYDFAGRVRKTHLEHTNPSADISSTTVTQEYEYDHAGRLLSVNHSLNGAASEILLSNTYNELGELANKDLANGAEDVDYAYNIRGWLTGLNSIERGIGNFFGMDLYYDDAPAGHQNYNGNIGSVFWNFGHSNFTQRYDYTYDPMDRLTAANYNGSGGSVSKDFDVSGITYDLNGNIQTLTRKGDDENKKASVAIDKLTYSYTKGNQLSKVKDTSGKTAGFRDGTDQATEYLYDENGNMKEDRNKGITSITYNYLNLPQKVTFSSAKYIEYTYDASGAKLSQKTVNSGTTKVTDYLGIFNYVDNKLQFLHHDEGRVVATRNDSEAFEGYEYQYHLKDHLGNVRATVRFEAESDTYLATLENDTRTKEYESTYFDRYGEVTRINADLFDHTDAGSTKTYSMRLNGTGNEVYGLAKSLAVQPGDWVWASVFAKYLDPSTRGASGSSFAQLIRDLENNASHVVTDGATAGTNPSIPFAGMMGHGAEDTGAPKAYLNILVFNEEDELVNFAYKQISTSASEDGSDVPHENMDVYTPIYEPGYVYIYLSNESGSRVEVFFDDFRVNHAHGLIVQKDDFYPFGLSFNAYTRPGEVDQKYLYQGKELLDDQNLNIYDFHARGYDPVIGRTWQLDPNSEEYAHLSPYSWTGNNPISNVDPDGKDWYRYTNDDGVESVLWREGNDKTIEVDGQTYNNIGALFAISLDDGSVVIYNQNEVLGIVDAEQPYSPETAALVGSLQNPEGQHNYNTMTPQWEMLFFSAETALMISGGSMQGQQGRGNRRIGGNNVKPRGENAQLNQSQQENLKRFLKKAPANAKQPQIRRLGNGNIQISVESPGKVPGSKAVYVKEIDSNGQTVRMYKVTSDPSGNIVHNKNKMR